MARVYREQVALVFAVLVLGLVALSALVSAEGDAEGAIVSLCLAGIAVIALFLMVLSVLEMRIRHAELRVEPRRVAARSVNGPWWEYILIAGPDGSPRLTGLTVVEANLSGTLDSADMTGHRYVKDGLETASWRAEGVAVVSLAPLRLQYFFGGQTTAAEKIPGTTDVVKGGVTGVGEFFFEAGSTKRGAREGSGWFATGDGSRFTDRFQVKLVRFDETEAKMWRSGDRQSLIRQRYLRAAAEYGELPVPN